jgi:hypothetical protein
MTMSQTFSYRPKAFSVEELKKIATGKHTNLNRLIEDAVIEKITKESAAREGGEVDLLSREISKVVFKFIGGKVSQPNQDTHEWILKKVAETDKKKAWVSDSKRRKS